MGESAVILGIDLGATNLRIAIAEDDSIVASHHQRTPTGDGDTVTQTIVDVIDTLCTDLDSTPAAITAVGVGSIGPLNEDGVTNPPNLPEVEEISIVTPIKELTKAPVTLHNDAIAGIIGERDAGAPPNSVYLTMSSGIGAGACVDDTILTGATGNAAEIGHLIVDPTDTLSCGCGGVGHWEAYCGGEAIPRHARHIHSTETVETTLPIDDPGLDAATVLTPTDDPLTTRITTRIVEYTTIGLAAITHAYNPATIIVGGAVARNHAPRIIEPARDRLSQHVITQSPTVRLTTLENPVLTGALATARRTNA